MYNYFEGRWYTMILVNAGHRVGIDNGGGHNGQSESKTNVNVAVRVAENLKAKGYIVKTTHDDPALNKLKASELLVWANKHNFEHSISIHQNDALDETAEGSETLCNSTDEKALLIAYSVQTELSKLGSKSRGIKFRNDLAMLKIKNCHCILVEGAFMTAKDNHRIDTLTEQWAQGDAISNGFMKAVE